MRIGSDLVGKTFTRLTVVYQLGASGTRNTTYGCRCSCGKTLLVRRDNLLSGSTKSCGCWVKDFNSQQKKDAAKERDKKHSDDIYASLDDPAGRINF